MYNYGYGYGYDYDSLTGASVGLAAIGSMLIIYLIILLVVAVLQIVAMWKIFTKAGEAGWKSIIPVYNIITLFKISGISPLFVLVYLAAIIPYVGWIAVIGMTIYLNYNLSKSFGKDIGFTVGLCLLGTIFYLILGFGKAEYVGSPAGTPTNTAQ